MRYVIFPTDWGFFGMAGDRHGICRTCLPLRDRQTVCQELLRGLTDWEEDPAFCAKFQRQIIAYFEGHKIDFSSDFPLIPEGIGGFGGQVLRACRKVPFGRTKTYGELAARIGRPGAARAVGSALARNPIPLLIPCHRIIRSDGNLGGFSAPGGTAFKRRLLLHERRGTS
jgi:methylated-DNA-[protein]-cysteine S-methyltransferase